MKIKKSPRKLDANLVIVATIVLIAVVATLLKGGWHLTVLGLLEAGQLIQKVWLYLLLGLLLGGLVQKLTPSTLIARWLGHTSGIKGIIAGSYLGIFMPAGPYAHMPIIAAIYRAGAGVGPIIALCAGRAMLNLQLLLVWQIPFLGMAIPLSRYIACLLLPPIVGLAGRAVYQLLTRITRTSSHS
ncbi:permease [Chloroflexota bacterium]